MPVAGIGSAAEVDSVASLVVALSAATSALTATLSPARLGVGGFATTTRQPFGSNAALAASDPTTTSDFLGHSLNTTFTGDFSSTVSPDDGFFFGANLYTVTGTASGDGSGMASAYGVLAEFDVRSAAAAPPAAAPFSGRSNIEYAIGLASEVSFMGAFAASNVYSMTSLRVSSPKYKNGAATTRAVNDAVLNGTTTITSATAAFVGGDVGVKVVGLGIPYGTTIASVTNGTTALLSTAATTSATGVTVAVGAGGVVTGPAYGLYVEAVEGSQVGSTTTYAIYTEAGNHVLNGPVRMDLTQMTGLNLAAGNMDMRSGVLTPAIGIKVPAGTFNGRLIDIINSSSAFQLFNVTNSGAVQSAGTVSANFAGTTRAQIGNVGPSSASALGLGGSSSYDTWLYRASAGVLAVANAGDTAPVAQLKNTGAVQPGTTAGVGGSVFSGSGAPNITGSVAGDFYLRTDTPGTVNQRLYVATADNTWTGIL